MTNPVSLAAQGLRKMYGKSGFQLEVPDIDVPAGETLALIGPSGSGKTTLLQLLGLLDKPDEGTIFFDGRPVTMSDKGARRQMAAVFQRPYLFKGSVGANVEYGLVVRGVGRQERVEKAAEALERVGLAGYENRSAMQLSGGEAQRVSLARALVIEPRVLLLDEPLASLDRLLRRHLIKDFATILSDSGVTVVYVTHDQDEALIVAHSIAIMNEGRIVAHGPAEDIAGLAADEWSAGFLGVEPAMLGTVVEVDGGLASVSYAESVVYLAGAPAPGTEVFFSVRPEDVLLFPGGTVLPPTTARNRIEAVVTCVEPRGATLYATLEAGGLRVAASVSRAAASELGVVAGARLLAVFKASAVRWRSAAD